MNTSDFLRQDVDYPFKLVPAPQGQPHGEIGKRLTMTIRLRLTLWYTALLGITLILFSVLVYSFLAANLWVRIQDDAGRRAAEVSTAITQQLQLQIVILPNPLSPPRVQLGELDFFASGIGVQFVWLNGQIIERSENLSRARGCGAMTSIRSAIVNPGVYDGTMNALRPRDPGASLLRAKTM